MAYTDDLPQFIMNIEVGDLETYRTVDHQKFIKPAPVAGLLNQPIIKQDYFNCVKQNLARLDLPTSDDFLFGQYIARLVLADYHKKKKPLPMSIKSFHGGMSSDDTLKGVFETLHKSTKWNFYGCDRKPLDKYNRYVGNTVDIFNINSARVVCNQAEQITAKTAGGEFDFCIMDVKPRGSTDVLIMSLFSRVVKRGKLIVIRLPDDPRHTLDVIAFLAMSHAVQVFKSPFGRVKYYLFLKSTKKYPEATVLNFLSRKENINIVCKVPDEIIYNLAALMDYTDKKLTQDKALSWYFKSHDLLK